MALAQNVWMVLPAITLASASLCLLLIPVAVKLGWVDQPGPRKLHLEATPMVGGLAVFLALLAGMTLTSAFDLTVGSFFLVLIIAAASLLVTGMVDDVRNLSSTLRFLMQAAACLVMILYGSTQLTDFGQLFGAGVLELHWFSVPITVFAALGVINSFNLVDGLDGLAGTLFLVAAGGMALFAAAGGADTMLWFLLVSMCAVLGFVFLNARFPWNDRARIFLGDAGSLMLGFLLAWSFIRLGNGPGRVFMPMTAVWLFAVPLLDTSTLIWQRWREGKSAFSADQNHLHHAFLRAGYSVEQTWLIISAMAILLAAVGIVFEFSRIPNWLSFYAFMCVAFTYYFYLKHCWASQRFLGRHFIHHDFEIEEGYA